MSIVGIAETAAFKAQVLLLHVLKNILVLLQKSSKIFNKKTPFSIFKPSNISS